jgi:predicted dehydrogenase
MVEKPMGLTTRACRLIADAAASTSAVLSVAENYRRDPMNRLARALLDSGAVGSPRLLVETSIGGGHRIFLTPWRHQKDASGLVLDVGVHYGDMMEYFLGDAIVVYAQTRLYEPIRYRGEADRGASGFYGRWPLPEQIDCTAEDAAYAVITFASGAVAQYTEDHAARGRGLRQRLLFTSEASLDLPNDRSGRPIRLASAVGDPVEDARILERVPEFLLDETTAALFGGDRLWRYDFPFPETDRRIIAIEYHDFGRAIREGRPPEVTAEQGARAVAVAYAMLESGLSGAPVHVPEVMSGAVDAYQREIDVGLGLPG